jgi:hypothetical protein
VCCPFATFVFVQLLAESIAACSYVAKLRRMNGRWEIMRESLFLLDERFFFYLII